MSDTASPTTTRLLGGRYRIHREIARGGMAAVFHAVDEVLERDVAVKMLHRHLSADPTFLDRFLREARAAARLTHPNVVSVFDRGEDEGEAYLVMEYVDGTSLRGLLRERNRLRPDEAAGILAAAATGIGAAHDSDLVHRDVKPENVLISSDRQVKVADFGLARAVAATTHTFEPGSLVGSPHYLAPEAVRDEKLDARADVYSLGVVLYECLTGRPPFEGDTAMATALRHTADVVPPPSETIDIADALDEVVLRATAPEPADRYADAGTFAAALREAVPSARLPDSIPDTGTRTVVLPSDSAETVVRDRSPDDSPAPPMFGPSREAAASPGAATGRGRPAGPAEPSSGRLGSHAADREGRRERTRRRRARGAMRRFLLPLALVVTLVGAGLAVWATLIKPVADVPDVISDTRAEAVEALEAEGFVAVIDPRPRTHPRIPEGSVVLQDPVDKAREGAEIRLVLSDGPPPVAGGVPDVVGNTEAAAVARLREAGLEPRLERRHHEEVPESRVIGTEPATGEDIDMGASVTIVVSDGPAPISVPGVVGSSVASAVAALEDLGLSGTVVSEVFDNEVPAGIVLGQSPAPGETLHRGDGVELTVSKGPQGFAMPEVRGMTRKEAVGTLEGLDLVIEVVEVERGAAFWREKGTVADQEPKPDTTVYAGETVKIFVWK